MSIQLEHSHVDPFQAVSLTNDAMRVVVIPELGGKIVSLRSCSSGREWLWRNPHLPLRKPPANASNFGLFDAGGWDEIFPTVDPCRVPDSAWGDRMLTDHGELWYRQWRTLEAGFHPNGVASLTLAVDDPEMPFRFERTLSLPAGTGPLTVSYQLMNRADQPLPYIWAAHPLLVIEPGDSIRLPSGTRMTSTGKVGLEFAAGAASFTWPTVRLASGRMLDLSRIPQRDARFAVKLFAESVSPGGIEIVDNGHRDSVRLAMADVHVPHIGLWLNYGAWSGANAEPYFNIGVEPTTSPHDNLSVAIRRGAHLQLLKGESRCWQLAVTVGTPLNHNLSAGPPP
jgi:galactose mutarotase-like enzyme